MPCYNIMYLSHVVVILNCAEVWSGCEIYMVLGHIFVEVYDTISNVIFEK